MNDSMGTKAIEKLKTGIPGFDTIAEGGLPKGRTTLLTGTSGSGKTIFACQFLIEGIREGQSGVFVTFEESPAALRQDMLGFGWDIAQWEAEGKWLFVDASLRSEDLALVGGKFDLGPLLTRIDYAVQQVGAERVSIDSLGALFSYVRVEDVVRTNLVEVVSLMRDKDLTAVLTTERSAQYGDVSRYGIEEFVADNVVLLRHVLANGKRQRTVEILKSRGTSYRAGEHPFAILPQQGMLVVPLSAVPLEQRSSMTRLSGGNSELDKMCGGGFFRDSITLVSGATGTGKTLLAAEFVSGGLAAGERCLFFSFEESKEQLIRNARGWGKSFEAAEQQGLLQIYTRYPEAKSLEGHLIDIKQRIETFQPNRVVIDSVSALERVAHRQNFREFLVGLNSWIKTEQIAGLFTSNTTSLTGGISVTDTHISTSTDAIILLRYIEVYGTIRRGIAVLKMRGSYHEKDIREFTITDHGMEIGLPFRQATGILSGMPGSVSPDELDRLSTLFQEDE